MCVDANIYIYGVAFENFSEKLLEYDPKIQWFWLFLLPKNLRGK